MTSREKLRFSSCYVFQMNESMWQLGGGLPSEAFPAPLSTTPLLLCLWETGAPQRLGPSEESSHSLRLLLIKSFTCHDHLCPLLFGLVVAIGGAWAIHGHDSAIPYLHWSVVPGLTF